MMPSVPLETDERSAVDTSMGMDVWQSRVLPEAAPLAPLRGARLVPPGRDLLLPPGPALPADEDAHAQAQQHHPEDQRDDPVRQRVDRVEEHAPGHEYERHQRRGQEAAPPQRDTPCEEPDGF